MPDIRCQIKPKKMLIIDLDNIGDVVLASFLPRQLKELYPDSQIDVLIKEYSQEVLANNPFVNELIIFNPPWLGDLLHKRFNWRDSWRLIKKLHSRKYDLAVVVEADWRKALIAKLAKIPQRVGAAKKKAQLFLTRSVPHTEKIVKHVVEYNMDLLRPLGAGDEEVRLEVFIDERTRQWADDFLSGHNIKFSDIVIGIHPGAGDPAKVWPEEYFISLVNKLTAEQKIKILVTESKGDKHAAVIVAGVNNDQVIAVENISVSRMAAIFQRCKCVVSGDTGPMHLATAVGAKVVAIFGPTDERRFGPYGKGHMVVKNELECSPCGGDPHCAEYECMDSIDVEQVLEAVEELCRDKNDE